VGMSTLPGVLMEAEGRPPHQQGTWQDTCGDLGHYRVDKVLVAFGTDCSTQPQAYRDHYP
jgi:hypothetical protein